MHDDNDEEEDADRAMMGTSSKQADKSNNFLYIYYIYINDDESLGGHSRKRQPLQEIYGTNGRSAFASSTPSALRTSSLLSAENSYDLFTPQPAPRVAAVGDGGDASLKIAAVNSHAASSSVVEGDADVDDEDISETDPVISKYLEELLVEKSEDCIELKALKAEMKFAVSKKSVLFGFKEKLTDPAHIGTLDFAGTMELLKKECPLIYCSVLVIIIQ